MKKENTNRFENNWIHDRGKTIRECFKKANLATLCLLLLSVGTVISGILFFPASIGMGLVLILLGTIVLGEV